VEKAPQRSLLKRYREGKDRGRGKVDTFITGKNILMNRKKKKKKSSIQHSFNRLSLPRSSPMLIYSFE
jgi:hypothetical protein